MNDVFLSLKIVFILANRANPDEMPPYAFMQHFISSSLFTKASVYQHPEWLKYLCQMGIVSRKTVFRVQDQARLNPASSAIDNE